MEQAVKNISIERIRKAVPELKGIGSDVLIDHTEYRISERSNPIYRYPLRLDGLLIAIREKGEAHFSLNLKEFRMGVGDIFICSPGDILQMLSNSGEATLSQTMMISSAFLKEMYIGLNSFMPFFSSQKEQPVFHLEENEVQELGAYFKLIEDAIEGEDYFKSDIVKRLLAAYLYKLGSILYLHRPELKEAATQPLKREEILFKQFINLLGEHHCKERRVDFYADQLFLSPKHFSTVIKKVSGKTAGEWIDEYVVLEIKTLLKYSPMTIQEVAYYMNFPNPSFFGKYFKHHTGMSPSEYKAQM